MKHALDLQVALVAVARSLTRPSVEISAADGALFFDCADPSDLTDALLAFAGAAPPILDAGRKLERWRYNGHGAPTWRLDDGRTFRAVVSIVLTEEERDELRDGTWAFRQRGLALHGFGLKVEAPACR